MASWRPFVAVVTLASIMAHGCGGSTADLVGKWSGELSAVPPEGAHPAVIKTVTAVHLEIREDGTFTLTEMGVGFSGNVYAASDGAKLGITKVMDRRVEEGFDLVKRTELRLIRTQGGGVTVEEPMGLQDTPILLTRAQ